MTPDAMIEPRLFLRGLRITLPEGVMLFIDDSGLAGTESAIEFCDIRTDGEPGEIRIAVAGRAIA